MMIAFLAILACFDQPKLTHDVTLRVHVEGPSGALRDVPLCARGPGGKQGSQNFALTDQSGDAVLHLVVPRDAFFVMVLPRLEPRHPEESAKDCEARLQAPQAVLEKNNFEGLNLVPVVEVQDEYSLKIDARPARAVSLTVFQLGKPLRGATISVSHCCVFEVSGRDGAATVKGVGTTESFVFAHAGRDIARIRVAPGKENVDLGNVEVSPSAGDAQVKVAVRGQEKLDLTYSGRGTGLTLISEGGERIISLPTHPGDQEEVGTTVQNGVAPSIPPGMYYIAPGQFHATPAQIRLLERVLAHGKLDGIPVIHAVSDQTTSLEIDAVAADRAILVR